jgi:uncharacterized membrane protein
MSKQEPWQADLQARMEAISEALARMLRRDQRIEARLERIERALNLQAPDATPHAPNATPDAMRPESASPVPFPNPVPILEPVTSFTDMAPAAAASTRSAMPPPLPDRAWQAAAPPAGDRAAEASGLETRFGLNWLNRVAVVTLILGAGFAFKYAVDNQWIGPAVRVALGIACGTASLSLGEWMSLRGQTIFARGVTGLGLALLYLSFYATFGLYHLLPQSLAFLLMAAATAAAGGLAFHYNSLAVGILGLLGGYLTPGLLSAGENRPWTLFGYLFLMNAGAVVMARTGRWRSPAVFAFVATTLYYAGWAGRWFGEDMRVVATVAALAFYGQFAMAGSRALSQFGQVLASIGVFSIWPDPSRAFPLAWAVALSGLATAEWRGWPEAPVVTGAAFWIPVWILWRSQSWGEHPGLVFLWLTLVFAALLTWVFWWIGAKARDVRPAELWVVAAGAPVYFATSYALLNSDYHQYMGGLAAALAILHALLAWFLWKTGDAPNAYTGQISAAIAGVFLTLAIPIQFSGFRVTIAWVIQAAACAWLAHKFASSRLTFGAGILLVLVLVRLVVRDAEVHTNAFFNARLLVFVVSAAGYLFAGWCLKEPVGAAFTYCTGHLILLAGLALEIYSWAERSAADIASAATTGISILTAVYALALIAAGAALCSALNRLFGLALLAVVIAKLYLIDVWALNRGFRILAFIGLGALLLLVSYLYSRFRPMMEKWWKHPTSGAEGSGPA